jgi:hypothetical protein
VLVHRTWDGTSPRWSRTVIDVPGTRHVFKDGEYLGGGRPGMPTVSPTNDGRWLMTFEYWGGGTNVRYRVGRDPLRFRASGGSAGTSITKLPVGAGSSPLAEGGSPVIVVLPDGRMVFNAADSGSVWTNDGTSTGSWTEHRTPSRAPTAAICNTSPRPGASSSLPVPGRAC